MVRDAFKARLKYIQATNANLVRYFKELISSSIMNPINLGAK